MAANHQYISEWQSPKSAWRWRLVIRPAEGVDITTYTDVMLPPGVITVRSISRKFSKKPLGMAEAMGMSVLVLVDELAGTTELEYLRDQLQKGYHLIGDYYGLNCFILTTDGGDAGLATSAFKTAAVCAQKPTLERSTNLRGPVELEIEAVDAFKVAMEMKTIEDAFASPFTTLSVGGNAEARLQVAEQVFDWYLPSVKRYVSHPEARMATMRDACNGLKTAAMQAAAAAFYVARKRTLQAGTYVSYVSGKDMHPIHPGWTFYRYDFASDDLNAKVAISRADLVYMAWISRTNGDVLSGWEYKNSEFSPAGSYDNWWTWYTDMAECFCAKGRLQWADDLISGTPAPIMEFDGVWGNYGASVATIAWDDLVNDAPFIIGFEVLRTVTVLERERNDEIAGFSEKDLTEWSHGTTLSVVDEEWGVKEVTFNNLPEAAGSTDIVRRSYYDNQATFRIWFNVLYHPFGTSPVGDTRYNRIHHYCEVNDGIETVSADAVTESFSTADTPSRQAAVSLHVQQASGGMPGVIARSIYRSLARANQAKLTTTLRDLDMRLMPMRVGDAFLIDAPADIKAMYPGTFDERAVLISSSIDLESEEQQVEFLIRGSEDPL